MDPHDTPTPDLETMRAEVYAYVDALDPEVLTELWRMLTAIYGPAHWWWDEDGGDRGEVP
jgi:hypothetical protein